MRKTERWGEEEIDRARKRKRIRKSLEILYKCE